MNIKEFDERVEKLNFTKEEEFKVRQVNELILEINRLRRAM